MHRTGHDPRRGRRFRRVCCTTLLLTLSISAAPGQVTRKAAFVANSGNLEGSVSSFTFNADGSLNFVQKIITGERPSTSVYEPGCNPYTIAISPNGRYLATGHASSDDPIQQVTLLEVASDATLSVIYEHPHPDTAMDVEWIDDRYLAALRTDFGQTNQVIIYELDADTPALVEVDRGDCGTFTTSLAVHPSRTRLYAGDSNANRIYPFQIAPDGTLTPLASTATGNTYPLGVGVSPDGLKLYAGGGISSGGHAVLGYHILPAGTLQAMTGTPFNSPGESPKDTAFSSDASMLFVSHGTDATVRSFLIDAETGAPTATGFFFDVGMQGSLGDHAVLHDWLLVTDNTTALDGVRGLYSFDILPNGGLAINGAIVDTQGINPREIAVWRPPCPGDTDGDDDVDLVDLAVLLGTYGLCHGDPGYVPQADFNGDDCVTLDDLAELLGHYGQTCL